MGVKAWSLKVTTPGGRFNFELDYFAEERDIFRERNREKMPRRGRAFWEGSGTMTVMLPGVKVAGTVSPMKSRKVESTPAVLVPTSSME